MVNLDRNLSEWTGKSDKKKSPRLDGGTVYREGWGWQWEKAENRWATR